MKSLQECIDLDNQIAIVTGGAKGIGFGISYRLAEAGAQVLIADTDLATATQAAKELQGKGWRVEAIKTDVSDEQAVVKMIEECNTLFGPVSILVNNAGIYPNMPIATMSAEDFEKVIHINLKSVFLTTKYASSSMKKSGKGGKIINITSIDALHPSMVGLAHYDASKHGVWGFTKNSALELANDNIWVNAVAPGGIATPGVAALQNSKDEIDNDEQKKRLDAFLDNIPMHRMGEADEIGKVVLFLASDLASYITGSQIVVDGGALLS